MTPAQWERVRDLFERALDLSAADVGPFLAREAADDGAVRAEVASLLDHHSQAGTFLSEPAAAQMPGLLGDEAESPLVPGTVLGSYTIVRELGRGGMGRVYLANDARLGRTVALKAAPPELTGDPLQRERLRREARAAAALTHPGICTVYALEELDGELYLATEYVAGRTFREELGAGVPPNPLDVLDTARQLAAALAAAHARGVVHRDLKPENVMRLPDGRVKVLDFGLARVVPAEAGPAGPISELQRSVTAPGTLVGTPAYMAPEQLNGEAADARADVFAFGVLMYEYATGVHPFEGATALAVAARVLGSEPQPLRGLRPDVPEVVVQVVERCLRKAPADRFASAIEISAALKGLHEPAQIPVVSAATTGWWRTHQAVVLGLYFLCATLAWQVKEWQPGIPQAIFLTIGIAATVGGVFRGHLLFTERTYPAQLTGERHRAAYVTAVVDGAIGLATALNGLLLARDRPLASALTLALGVGLVLARFILEPSTTRAAFVTKE